MNSDLNLNDKVILYVDDDYVNYLYFSELLSGTGAVLERVYNPDHALVNLLTRRKVCVIMVMSPFISKTNSIIVEKIKEIAPEIPIIGIMEYEDKQMGPGANSYDIFLSRHIDDTNLIETLSDLLDYS